jgi:hypothetical protein
MSGDSQVAAIEWTMIAKERRDRIVAILGQMIQRRMAGKSLKEAAADEWNLPEPEIEWTSHAREDSRGPHGSTRCRVRSSVNDAAGRTTPGVDSAAVRVVRLLPPKKNGPTCSGK